MAVLLVFAAKLFSMQRNQRWLSSSRPSLKENVKSP
jgi:hypothetical protein